MRYDDRSAQPEARLLKTEVIETLLYGCVTCTFNATCYDALRRAHLEVLRRVLSFQRCVDRTSLSYANVFKKAKSERIETAIRKRRLFFARAMVRQNEGHAYPVGWCLRRLTEENNTGSGGPLNHGLRSLRYD